jgi:hydroxyacylglutathione hydrolase
MNIEPFDKGIRGIELFAVGPLEANAYVVADNSTKDALIIDPGDEPDRLIDFIEEKHLTIIMIVLTHAHFDHISGVSELKSATGANIVIHKKEEETYRRAPEHALKWGFKVDDLPSSDVLVEEGDMIKIGNLSFTVIHTPGHTPGGISLYGEANGNKIVFTGDTLFQGSVGRTDLEGGNVNALKESFRRLMELPPDTTVCSGHGGITTIGHEKTSNFFSFQFLS